MRKIIDEPLARDCLFPVGGQDTQDPQDTQELAVRKWLALRACPKICEWLALRVC